MNKLMAMIAGATLMCGASLAVADDAMMKGGGMHPDMSTMDANGDGMVSRDEFMQFHQTQWDRMPKNKDGMVAMKDMQMMHHDRMSGQPAMMHGKDVQDDKMKQDAVKKTDGGN